MTLYTRRRFLATSSVLAAGAAVGAQEVAGLTRQDLATTGDAWVPPAALKERMHTLALAAMDAARQAGASYADIRLVDEQTLSLSLQIRRLDPGLGVGASFSYGIRVIVDGAWAFVHGHGPTVDHVVSSAKSAVARARSNARVRQTPVDLVAVPVVEGEWRSPVDILPFTVSLRDQLAQLAVFNEAMLRAPEVTAFSGSVFEWRREVRTFASSDGSLVTQQMTRSEPSCELDLQYGSNRLSLQVLGLHPKLAGYEAVLDPSFPELVKSTAQEGARMVRMSQRPLDVGRYPVVFRGAATGTLLAKTVTPALELDRVLGFEADASGASYLAPAEDILESPIPIFSPLLTVIGDRSAPSATGVKWDDDGVEPVSSAFVERGYVREYYTTRETASSLRDTYARLNRPLKSQGYSVATKGDDLPTTMGGHVTMQSSDQVASLDSLIQDIQNGMLVYSADVHPEPGLNSGLLQGIILHVQKGKIVARLGGAGVLFKTKQLWKESLMVVGDSTTVQPSVIRTSKGFPWMTFSPSVSAPAVLFKDLDVVNYAVR